jgi:tRNA-Thr(GGU) m(6)t(6)A37 methyltransferase TsaA
MNLTPIGRILSPYKTPEGTPIQPRGGIDTDAVCEIDPSYAEGLSDLAGFSHIYLIYWFHRVKGFSLKVKPFLDSVERGVFSTRAPKRPNPIGFSVVRLIGVEENRLMVRDIDILDETPLLDIKPYVPDFDMRENVRVGWLARRRNEIAEVSDDGRFSG